MFIKTQNLSLEACFYYKIFMIFQIILKCEQNHRAPGISINNECYKVYKNGIEFKTE